jgi:uncharacterized protein (TIGR03435 family)
VWAGWMSTERCDIEAKAFDLEVHHETKEMTNYALVVGKNGSKLPPIRANLLSQQIGFA